MLKFSFALMKKFVMNSVIFAITVFFSTQAHAEGFSLYDWSARGSALAGGLVARGGDASVVAYNPAAMSKLEGTQIMVGADFIIPKGSMTINGVKEAGSGGLFIIPSVYATHTINETFAVGLGIFARFGLGAEHEDDWGGRYNVIAVDIQAVSINPNVAYAFNEDFSVSAGLEITTASARMENAVPFDGTVANDMYMNLDGDTFGLSFNLGAHYDFADDWSAGIAYRSRMKLDFTGDVNLTNLPLGAADATGTGTASIQFPDSISLGVAWQLIPQLSLGVDVSCYMWSSFEELGISFDNIVVLGTLVPDQSIIKNWKDTFIFALSAEYDVLEWLALRGGISYETSPLDEKYMDYLTPTNGRFKGSIGVGFKQANWSVDIGYIYTAMNDIDYAHTSTAPIQINPILSPIDSIHNDSKAEDMGMHDIAISLAYKF